MNSVLMHYGVKGMKWGIRKDPYSGYNAKPRTNAIDRSEMSFMDNMKFASEGGDYTIRKGAKLYRATSSPNEDISGNKRTYVSQTTEELSKYEEWVQSLSGISYTDIYTTEREITVAGFKEAIKILDTTYELGIDEELGEIRFWTQGIEDELGNPIRQDVTSITVDELDSLYEEGSKGVKDGLDILTGEHKQSYDVSETVNGVLVKSRNVKLDDGTRFREELIKAGYDAVVDLNDLTYAPTSLIIFDPSVMKKESKAK